MKFQHGQNFKKAHVTFYVTAYWGGISSPHQACEQQWIAVK
jgi:hypothetical protein